MLDSGRSALPNDIIAMTMEIENHKGHLAYRVNEATLVMLNAYREFGVVSRGFMLKEHGEILEQIRSRSGPFGNSPEKDLVFAEARIYVELIERTCQLLEDFSSLCYALLNDLSAFPQNILKKASVSERLQSLTDKACWYTLLRYPGLDTLQFSSEDKDFLRQHYEKNIQVLLNFVKVLIEFRKLHWRFYTKHKHANPLIYGIEKIELREEPTICIPAIDNAKHPEIVNGIIMNYSMYKKQLGIVRTITDVMEDLLDRAVLLIAQNGIPIIEEVRYYKMSATDEQRLRVLVERYNRNLSRNPVIVKLKLGVPSVVLRRFVEFYDNLDLGAFDT